MAADHGDHESLVLDPLSLAAAESRRYVRRRLAALHRSEVADNAAQVVSELVTNATIHAKTPVTVSVTLTDEGVPRVTVRDHSPVLPRPRSYGVDSTTGRGLRLVDALSHRWGVERVEPHDGGGKIVWFEPAADTDVMPPGDDWMATLS
jgi:anti-sigma regulatory factor (Ser/Thr protein kinase)